MNTYMYTYPSGNDCMPKMRGTGLSKYACKDEGRVTITGPAHFRGRKRLTNANTHPNLYRYIYMCTCMYVCMYVCM
jgi:hypothetical protein